RVARPVVAAATRWARSWLTRPYTTRPIPRAAPAATSTTIGGIESAGREFPASVDLFRPDSGRRGEAWTSCISLGGRGCVVCGRLELVLEDRVVEEPEQVLRVAGGHQQGQAAGDLGGP